MTSYSMTVWGHYSGEKRSTATIPCAEYSTLTRTDSNSSKLYVCSNNETDYPTTIAEIQNNGTYDVSNLNEIILSAVMTNGSWEYKNTVAFEFS